MRDLLYSVILFVAIFLIGISIHLRLDKINQRLSVDAKRVYQVEARYVLINPCDIWDVAFKDAMENGLK